MISNMPDTAKPEGSVEIFCSYSRKDESLREEFEAHVSLMRRKGLIQVWHDQQIPAGNDWVVPIDEHLNTADIIALFVSSDFLASDYCYKTELARAMERQSRAQVAVVPIIVRQCDWREYAPFAHIEALPTDGRPVTSWANRDEAWTDVAVGLKTKVKEVLCRIQEKLKAEVQPAVPNVNLDEALRNQVSFETLLTQYPVGQVGTEARRNQIEQMKRWQILQDTMTRIFEIQQDVANNAAKRAAQAKAYKSWDEYVKEA
jgi:hypothetical protein